MADILDLVIKIMCVVILCFIVIDVISSILIRIERCYRERKTIYQENKDSNINVNTDIYTISAIPYNRV
jgi:hypothetical protein